MKAAELREIEMRARKILEKLREKYPNLDAYLVYSSRLGQANLGGSPVALLEEFPAMFSDSGTKTHAFLLIQKRAELRRERNDLASVERELATICPRLEVLPDVQIELRFGQLRYELVWQLQVDDLVDKGLTDQSRRSIRIVLGTILSLGGPH